MGRKKCLSSNRKQNYNRKHKLPPLISPPPHLTVSVPLAKIHTSRLTLLKNALRYTTLPSGWTQVDHYKEEEILLCHLSHHGNKPIISHTIYIFGNISFNLSVYNQSNVTLTISFSLHNVESTLQLLNYIKTLKMCPGNGLTRYLTIAKQRGGTLKNKSG